jgi:hypothetical protein
MIGDHWWILRELEIIDEVCQIDISWWELFRIDKF